MTLKPFEIKIFQFGKKDRRFDHLEGVTSFTISFTYSGEENVSICSNQDIDISVKQGKFCIKCAECEYNSESLAGGGTHKINIVREKNKMIKLYIDNTLDGSAFCEHAKGEVSLDLTSSASDFSVSDKATPYDDIITLKEILGRKKRK